MSILKSTNIGISAVKISRDELEKIGYIFKKLDLSSINGFNDYRVEHSDFRPELTYNHEYNIFYTPIYLKRPDCTYDVFYVLLQNMEDIFRFEKFWKSVDIYDYHMVVGGIKNPSDKMVEEMKDASKGCFKSDYLWDLYKYSKLN